MKRIPIVIADDHPGVRAQVLARLEREADLQIVGVADTGPALVACAEATHPRVVLIDPMMSEGDGMEAIRRLRVALPETVVVVLTAFTDTAQRIELGKLGVRFILNKGIESYKLVDLLHQAAAPFASGVA